jgi:adenylate cyclase
VKRVCEVNVAASPPAVPPDPAPHEVRIGQWLLDAERNELRRDGGEAVRLEPKAIDVLRHLALRPGRVIGREELLSLVWPGVVVGDDVLTQAIIKLRKALGDESQSPRYIETIPKRGYRLIAPVGSPAASASGSGTGSASGAEQKREATGATQGMRATVATGTMEKEPERHSRMRFAVAAVVLLALAGLIAMPWFLERSGTPRPAAGGERVPASSFPLVAILPLANLSGEPSRDYLSDGLSADLIDALGRFSGLRVMSWNAVQAFKGPKADTGAVREMLAARYVVRGSVRESDGTIRVAIELSDAERGVQLWSSRYDGQGAQLFEMLDRIVRNLVGALAVKLTDIEQQRAFTQPTDSAEAYDLVLRARALLRLQERGANREARLLLARARKMAPGYDDAWTAAGEAEFARALFGWIEDPADGVRRAQEFAHRALALPDMRAHARAYTLLASLQAQTGQPEEALTHSERAIALNPSDTGSLFRHGHALLVLGRTEDAIATFETAMRYEPRPTIGPRTHLAWAYYIAGRYRDAVAFADMGITLLPERWQLHAVRAAALAQLGQLDEARRSAQVARRLNPRMTLEDAGTRLRIPEHAARVREGLAKAGL